MLHETAPCGRGRPALVREELEPHDLKQGVVRARGRHRSAHLVGAGQGPYRPADRIPAAQKLCGDVTTDEP